MLRRNRLRMVRRERMVWEIVAIGACEGIQVKGIKQSMEIERGILTTSILKTSCYTTRIDYQPLDRKRTTVEALLFHVRMALTAVVIDIELFKHARMHACHALVQRSVTLCL